MNTTKKIFLSALAVSLTVCIATAVHFAGQLAAPVTEKDNCRIFIRPSDTTDTVLQMISNADSSACTDGLRLLFRLKKSTIKPGCYTVAKGENSREILNRLVSGSQTPVRLVISSVRTVEQMTRNISSQLMADSAQFIQCFKEWKFSDLEENTPQDVFNTIIPNTYEVYWNISPEALMSRLVKENEKFWSGTRNEKAVEIGLTHNEVMTLASIVEEETAITSDMPVIAGLYMNRLKRNMPLQSDPTVIYAIGGNRPKRVLTVHLETDSPYNTYKHAGLPPGPIRFASIQSIDAVLNYSHHNYLYMCASDDLSGRTAFASTLAEHNRNAAKYRRAMDRAGIYR